MPNLLRNIPTVSELLESVPLKRLSETVSRNAVVSGVRKVLGDLRTEVRTKAGELHLPTAGELAERIARWIMVEEQPKLRPVINATGVLLPEDLGRAPLAREAIDEIATMAAGYASIEFDLATGQPMPRSAAVETLLREATGAEAAMVVNNNAGGALVALAALAAGREIIVSRGQLIEIGGSYRLPEIVAASGAMLREVGMNNRTVIANYEQAIGDTTAAVMRIDTLDAPRATAEEVPLAELVALAHRKNLLVFDDLGSGTLIDFAPFGVSGTKTIRDSLRAGVDLVLLSGDKLLGGPQCGILLGRKDLLAKIAQHPLARVVRADKLALAALAATLRLYRDAESAPHGVPLLSLLSTPLDNLKNRAERLAPQMAVCPALASATPVPGQASLASGPASQRIASWCIALAPRELTVEQLASTLRNGTPAVVGRIEGQQLLLDLRSVPPSLDILLVDAVERLAPTHSPN